MKIAVVTCYGDPDNPRAVYLRDALKSLSGNRVYVIKNTRRSWLRYPEVVWKLWQLKRTKQPEAYLLTFRGQELLPILLRIARKRPVWFDECIVPISYVSADDFINGFGRKFQRLLTQRSLSSYRRWLHRCKAVIVENDEQAETSARTARMNLSRYLVVATPQAESATTTATSRQLAQLIADATV